MTVNLSSTKVPPSGPLGAEILIIGESPGRDEERLLTPFIGPSGDLLNQILSSNGIPRESVRVANICNYRPANNDFKYCVDTEELAESLKELFLYLDTYPPKLIIGLGNAPLKYLCGRHGISDWRGSLLSTSAGLKYFATLHPAFVLHSGVGESIIDYDIRKSLRYLRSNFEVHNLGFQFKINPRGYELEELAQKIESSSNAISIDIENIRDTSQTLCCGFGLSNTEAYCIVNHSYNGMDLEFSSFCKRILENPAIPKILHNCVHDHQVKYLNGIKIQNIIWDTIVAQHVLTPELPRDLGALCSYYTDIPCYWSDMAAGEEKSWSERTNKEKLYTYNCMDCVATYQVYEKQKPLVLNDPDFKHTFDYEMDMLQVSFHISESGFLRDEERRLVLRDIIDGRYIREQKLLNNIAQKDINVKSPRLSGYLYDELKLPVRKNHDGGLTTDEDAIVSLIAFTKDKYSTSVKEDTKAEWKRKLAVLKLILRIRGYRQLLSNYINSQASTDGRLRSQWKVAATKTGRWSCAGYVDGTGINAQTFPREVIDG